MKSRSDFLLHTLLVAAANIAFVVPIDIVWDRLTVLQIESTASDTEIEAPARDARLTEIA